MSSQPGKNFNNYPEQEAFPVLGRFDSQNLSENPFLGV